MEWNAHERHIVDTDREAVTVGVVANCKLPPKLVVDQRDWVNCRVIVAPKQRSYHVIRKIADKKIAMLDNKKQINCE